MPFSYFKWHNLTCLTPAMR